MKVKSIKVDSMKNKRIERYIVDSRVISIAPKSVVTFDAKTTEAFLADTGAMSMLKHNHNVEFIGEFIETVETKVDDVVKDAPKTVKELNEEIKACETLEELEHYKELAKEKKSLNREIKRAEKRLSK